VRWSLKITIKVLLECKELILRKVSEIRNEKDKEKVEEYIEDLSSLIQEHNIDL
jgi:hypothetical protein